MSKLSRLLLLLSGLGMFAFPKITAAGAASGLLQWYRSILPTLLPFLLFARLFRVLFPLRGRRRALPLCLMGLLCGYPAGAILAGEEVKAGTLSPAQGQLIAGVCNLPSPAFLISLLAVQWLGLTSPLRPAASLWLAAGSYGAVMLLLQKRTDTAAAPSHIPTQESGACAPALSARLLEDACRVVVVIGCYMILFGILSAWLAAAKNIPQTLRLLLLLCCEITTGCQQTAASALPAAVKELMCTAGAAFGGLSCLAQTAGCLEDTGLRLAPYAAAKIVIALLACGFDLFFLNFS